MKNLIKALIVLAVVSISRMGLHAQNKEVITGVFFTEQDYHSNRLSYVLGSNDKLLQNEFFSGKHISIVYQGKKIKLAKSSIFGYRLSNTNFRLYNNEAYKIIDTAGFMLYTREKLTPHIKGYAPEKKYFYSVTATGAVADLTIENLCNSFPGKPGFRYSIQNTFNNDNALASYDKFLHQYKIKYLYLQQTHIAASHLAAN